MKLIVSNILEDKFSDFVVKDDFQWIEDNMEDISTLIFHSSKESDFTVGVYISKLSQQGNTNFLYINANPQTTIKMVIAGAGGKIITDEFYLEDEEELLELLKSNGISDEDSETALANASVQVVKDFVQSFVRGDNRIKTKAYLDSVNDAINRLSDITAKQELQITNMGNSAIDIFKKASYLIQNLENNRKKIEDQLKKLEITQETVSTSTNNTFNSTVTMYPPIKYMNTTPVLLLREFSPCRYLTSFAVGYTHHIHFARNKRVKLIVVHQKGAGVAAKYEDFTMINESSANYSSLYGNELIATNTPTKDIMRTLLSQPVDAFIIVDRLYGNQSIVDGRICRVNAISGLSDLDRFNLEPSDTIVSIQKHPDIFATLITLKDYVSDKDARQAAYEQLYETVYGKLDALLGV